MTTGVREDLRGGRVQLLAEPGRTRAQGEPGVEVQQVDVQAGRKPPAEERSTSRSAGRPTERRTGPPASPWRGFWRSSSARGRAPGLVPPIRNVFLIGRPVKPPARRHATCTSRRPAVRQRLGLFQHRPCRGLLLVRRVAVLSQYTLHEAAQVGADVLAHGPVDGHVAAARS